MSKKKFNIGGFTSINLPFIKQIFPRLITDDIIGFTPKITIDYLWRQFLERKNPPVIYALKYSYKNKDKNEK